MKLEGNCEGKVPCILVLCIADYESGHYYTTRQHMCTTGIDPPGETVVPENIFGTFIKGYKPHVLAKDKVPTVHTTTYLSSFRISLPNGSTNGTLNHWKVFKTQHILLHQVCRCILELMCNK